MGSRWDRISTVETVDSHFFHKRLLDASISCLVGTSQLSNVMAKIEAMVDAHGDCIFTHGLNRVSGGGLAGVFYNLGVGFCVARSAMTGNAKASTSGTSNC